MSNQDEMIRQITAQVREQAREYDPFETSTMYRQRILQESKFTVNPSNLDREYLDQIYRQENIDFFTRQGYTRWDADAFLHQVTAYGLAQAKDDNIVPVHSESWMQVRNLEPFDFNHNYTETVLDSWNFHITNNEVENAHLEGTGGYTPSHEIELNLDRRIINAVAIVYGMECLDQGSGVYPVGSLTFMAGNVRVIDIYDTEDFYYTKGSLCVSPILVKRFDSVQVRFKAARPLPLDFSIKFRGLIFKRKQEEEEANHHIGAPIH